MKDRAFGVQRQHWLANQIPDAEVVTVDAGHGGRTLQPGGFVAWLASATESVHRRLPTPHHAKRAAT